MAIGFKLLFKYSSELSVMHYNPNWFYVCTYQRTKLIFGIITLNQVCAHSQSSAGCGWVHVWFTEFVFQNVCMYICLSFCTHVSKPLFTKNSLYVRNKGHIEPVLNFQAGKLWFKVVNACQFEIQVKQVYKDVCGEALFQWALRVSNSQKYITASLQGYWI